MRKFIIIVLIIIGVIAIGYFVFGELQPGDRRTRSAICRRFQLPRGA